MSYERFDSETQNSNMQQGFQHQNTTMVVAAGGAQPAPIIVAQQPYNRFAAKAPATRKIGYWILLNGMITLVLGVVMIAATLDYWTSFIASGIWTGVFVIIAGSLCIGAGANENNTCLRIGALVMNIIGMLATLSSCLLMFVGFGLGMGCDRRRCYTNYDGRWVCSRSSCGRHFDDTKEGSYISLAVALLNVIVFVLMLIASVYAGCGCCCRRNGNSTQSQGNIVMAPTQQSYGGPVVVSSNQAYSHQAYSQPQSHTGQPQQYSQAAMPSASGGQVTYGNDYQQQPRQEEQKFMPPQDVPPAYSRN
uniref:Uncharacterized protein n=1 Tax=Clytia hemisphaerica TaxID=252671 RepID=A0A7M5V142_9CNID